MRSSRLVCSLLAAAALGGGSFLWTRAASGEDPQPKSVAHIKDVMLTYNAGATSVVGVLKDTVSQATVDDEAWESASARATMTVEAGNMLLGMKPPRGADDAAGLAKWKQHVLDFRGCAEAAMEAAAKKDAAAVKTALMGLAKRCTECHKDHQKE